MSKLYCTVNYSFSKEVDEKTQKRMQEEFMKLRWIAIELLNPQYEHWNKEYDELGLTPASEDQTEYNKFIQGKQREVLRIVNNALGNNMITRLDSDEDADICGILKTDPRVIMHMGIKPIGDWGNLVK